MSEYELTITQRAKDAIIDIGDYITCKLLVLDISLRFIKNLKNAIQQLKFFSYKFPLVQDEYLKQLEIRCMPYKNYYIFYEVVENGKMVIVIRIGYYRRDWEEILKCKSLQE